MLEFKRFYNFSKAEKLEGSYTPVRRSYNLRRSLETSLNLKPNQKLDKATIPDFCKEIFQKTSQLPCFRPRSPLARLSRSLNIAKLSKTTNVFAVESSVSKNESRISSALSGMNNHFTELVNPHTPFKGSFLVIKKSAVYDNIKVVKKKSFKLFEAESKVTVKKIRKLEIMSIKEIKDKKWLNKKKSLIIQDFFLSINRSNGMRITDEIEDYTEFKYYVGKGNNSKLIKQLIGKRHGWVKVTEEEIETANFVWTEWIDSNIINSLPLSENNESKIEAISKTRSHQYKQNNLKRFLVDTTALGFGKIASSACYTCLSQKDFHPQSLKVYNKIQGNHSLSNKKELFSNLEKYCIDHGMNIFSYVPVTFHIVSSTDSKLKDFEDYFSLNPQQSNNIWIVKPGENTNRGTGIVICTSLEQIKGEIFRSKHTLIIQKYIENPFLISKRKFDLRLYSLVTCFNGIIQGYFYSEGYIRTSSKAFSLLATDNKYIHLTNDAVQKRSDDYGKYENGNKMSYSELQKYLDSLSPAVSINFAEEVLPKMKEIVALTIKCAVPYLKQQRRCHTFEVFGYDFLLDSELKPWLLEVNTNPCLEISSSHLARIIPSMLDNAFRIVIDATFHVSQQLKAESLSFPENKFELVYHSECKNHE